MSNAKRLRFGAALRELRKAHGYTLGDLARGLGVSVVVVSDLERGKCPGLDAGPGERRWCPTCSHYFDDLCALLRAEWNPTGGRADVHAWLVGHASTNEVSHLLQDDADGCPGWEKTRS